MRRRVFSISPPNVSYYVGADVSTGNWTPSIGGTLYGTLDEVTPSDADYDQSAINPSGDAMECGFAGVQAPQSGHLTFSYRIRGEGACGITVSLVHGGGAFTFTHSPAPSVWTQYDQDIDPVAIANWSSLRLRVVASAA